MANDAEVLDRIADRNGYRGKWRIEGGWVKRDLTRQERRHGGKAGALCRVGSPYWDECAAEADEIWKRCEVCRAPATVVTRDEVGLCDEHVPESWQKEAPRA